MSQPCRVAAEEAVPVAGLHLEDLAAVMGLLMSDWGAKICWEKFKKSVNHKIINIFNFRIINRV